jgi:hypothetical protein
VKAIANTPTREEYDRFPASEAPIELVRSADRTASNAIGVESAEPRTEPGLQCLTGEGHRQTADEGQQQRFHRERLPSIGIPPTQPEGLYADSHP